LRVSLLLSNRAEIHAKENRINWKRLKPNSNTHYIKMLSLNFTIWIFVYICATLGMAFADLDWNTANTSIWLSAGAYCPTEVYLNRTYLGYSTGFIPTKLITDEASDTAGYIGYIKEQSTIYVAVRGTVSYINWVDNIDALQVPFNHTECSGCLVHAGFNYAWNQVATKVVHDVMALHRDFPDYSIVVTGHSLGGALASLCALTLQEVFNADASVSNQFTLRAMQKLHVVPKIRLFTFGAPRFCNEAMATYISRILPDKNRITHFKDIVPHCPTFLRYTHIEGNIYRT
jgi:hypothetical protein